MIAVEYDPRLVEEAVLLRGRGERRDRELDRRREPIYEIADPEEREAAFRALFGEWFVRRELDRPLASALAEIDLAAGVARLLVVHGRTRRDEGAELFVREDRGRAATVVLTILPVRFLDPAELLVFLRRELLHVADMLDPGFGYEPRLPRPATGPAEDRLLRDRYRALWDATIDGRLARRGVGAPGARERCLADLRRLFPPGEAEAVLGRFFDGRPATHAGILAAAGAFPSSRCRRCGCPGVAPLPDDAAGDAAAPGLCLQCAALRRTPDDPRVAGPSARV